MSTPTTTYDCADDNLCDLNRSLYETDNRYRREWAPASAKVAYGARWIADFNERCSDIVPNRQGWAFDDAADRDLLVPAIDYLASTACSMIEGVEFVDGAWEASGSFEGANYRMLANGGYMHVEVWA